MTGNTERIILDKLSNLEDSVNSIRDHGCSKARIHDATGADQKDIVKRLRLVEIAQAEGKGKLAVAMVVIGVVITLITNWLKNEG